jgi:hypothetical protein
MKCCRGQSRDLLARHHYRGKDRRLTLPDPRVVFEFDEACLRRGILGP